MFWWFHLFKLEKVALIILTKYSDDLGLSVGKIKRNQRIDPVLMEIVIIVSDLLTCYETNLQINR